MTNEWKILKSKTGVPDGNVVTPLFRGCYVNLFEPKGIRGDSKSELKYSMAMLFPKGTDFTPLQERIREVAKEKWGDKADDVLLRQQNGDKRIFKKQGGKADSAGFEEGAIYLSANNKNKPGLVGKKAGPDGTLIEITDEDAVWSGDYFLAVIRPFAWDHPVGGKGVSLSLQHVQLFRKGERLGGGRVKPSDAFESYDEEDMGALDAPAVVSAGKDPFA